MTIQMIFNKVEQNPFDKPDHAPGDPDALYMWNISQVGSRWYTESGILYKELKPLLDFWNLQEPSQLIGRTFETPDTHTDASSALDLLLVTAKRKGAYMFPTKESLYDRAVTSLAAFQCPDFRDEDDQTVFEAFLKTFKGFFPDQEWFDAFKLAVFERSGNTIRIEQADPSEFSWGVRGPGVYLHLVRGQERKRFFFGPYSTPFQFDEQDRGALINKQRE